MAPVKRKLKVWGGLLHLFGGQHRTVVAAPTKKRALELLTLCYDNGRPFSVNYFNNYWSETGNVIELSVANEEGVWVSQTPDSRPGNRVAKDYKKQPI